MMPSGPPTPVGGGGQSALPSLLRSNSNLSNNSQQTYNSLVSPRTQFSNNGNNNGMNILGNISNVASLINQSMPNGAGHQHFGNSEPDPHSFTPSQNQQLGAMHSFQQQNGSSGQNGSSQQLQTMRNMSPQNLQTMRSLGPVKMEPQNMDSSTFLQQQQQQLMQMSRQSPQTAMQLNMLQQQQRIMQQQQLFKGLPPRAQMQQPQNGLPLRNQVKNSSYEPGICAKRLTQYMYYQKQRPEDNNIEFWRKFVAEFFASNAKKRWCVSLYGNGRQTNGVFPQDVWHCEICNRKPGRGFETTAEVLPRLCQIKYASGTLEELLYVDMPRESQNGMGQIVLDYPKAVQESVFEQLRVVRDGHLRIVFNPDLKIASWEFCARKHEELIPRRLIIPQVGQLGSVVQKYHNAAQNAPTGLSTQELQNNCNSFVASARQLAKALEVPLVNDLGYTKRYVRCLQISEVVNSMKDLIDHSKETGTGPMASLINFPRRNSNQQHEAQNQSMSESSNQNSQIFLNENIMQLPPRGNNENNLSNGTPTNVNSYANGPSSANSIARLLHHQNSMNSQVPSSSSQSQPNNNNNPSLPFSPSTPTSNGTHNNNNMDTQSSVQQIMQELITASSPNNGVSSSGNEMNNGVSGVYGSMGGIGPSGTVSGLRAAMASNGITMNGSRVGVNSNRMSHNMAGMNIQQDGNGSDRLMGTMGSMNNNFSNFNFDWKTSP